jgi:hypothetical protein
MLLSILAVITCHDDGLACKGASTISSLIAFGFFVVIVGGIIVGIFQWVGEKTRRPTPVTPDAGNRSPERNSAIASSVVKSGPAHIPTTNGQDPSVPVRVPRESMVEAMAGAMRTMAAEQHDAAPPARAVTVFPCEVVDCGYRSYSEEGLEKHREFMHAAPSEVDPDEGQDELRSEAPLEPSPKRDLKTCPDCAEDVRAAARKCRFCNYRFDAQFPTSDIGPGLR